jgi:hypothetical protein
VRNAVLRIIRLHAHDRADRARPGPSAGLKIGSGPDGNGDADRRAQAGPGWSGCGARRRGPRAGEESASPRPRRRAPAERRGDGPARGAGPRRPGHESTAGTRSEHTVRLRCSTPTASMHNGFDAQTPKCTLGPRGKAQGWDRRSRPHDPPVAGGAAACPPLPRARRTQRWSRDVAHRARLGLTIGLKVGRERKSRPPHDSPSRSP